MKTKIISFYSFREGTGRSTIVSEVAKAIAREKKDKKVGVVDLNLAAPGLRDFYPDQDSEWYINGYLAKEYSLIKAVNEIKLEDQTDETRIYFIFASPNVGDIDRSLNEPLDYKHLYQGLNNFISQYKLDYLLIDSPSGIEQEILLSISISNVIALVLRPDKQDYEETRKAIQVTKDLLGISQIFLIMNKLPIAHELHQPKLNKFKEQVKEQLAKDFGLDQEVPAIGILPYSQSIMMLSLDKFKSLLASDSNFPKLGLLDTLINKLFPSKSSNIQHSADFKAHDSWQEEINKIAEQLAK
jgi:septum site-determining protein MinD